MPLKPFRKKPANELVDVDVERIDGVDRPAHGRAFALYKSESGPSSTDADKIVAAVKRLMPSYDATIKGIISQAIDRHVVKMLDRQDKIVGYTVKSGTNTTGLMTFEAACALVAKYVTDEIMKGRRVQEQKPVTPATMISPANSAELSDPSHNASPDLHTQTRSLWERHRASKGSTTMINGVRYPAIKRKRGVMIDGRREEN
jgi:hypothetical protein